MSNKLGHSSHLVGNSPWPAVRAAIALGLCTGAIRLMCSGSVMLLTLRFTGLVLRSRQWWRDVAREARYDGRHSNLVETGIR